MRIKANIELDAGDKSFATGLLPELISALRRCRPGDLLEVISSDSGLGTDLEAWCRFTRNSLVDAAVEVGRNRWVIRRGEAPSNTDSDRPIGSRLWLYTNFDCNLHCDYCCVRSSPKAPRRELGLARVQRIANEAVQLGVSEIFVTGGEPFCSPTSVKSWLRVPLPRQRRSLLMACCSRGGGSTYFVPCHVIV